MCPNSWFIFLSIYGKTKAPEICRGDIDIYKRKINTLKKLKIKRSASLEARSAISRMWNHYYAVYPNEPRHDEKLYVCGCIPLTRMRFDCILQKSIICISPCFHLCEHISVWFRPMNPNDEGKYWTNCARKRGQSSLMKYSKLVDNHDNDSFDSFEEEKFLNESNDEYYKYKPDFQNKFHTSIRALEMTRA